MNLLAKRAGTLLAGMALATTLLVSPVDQARAVTTGVLVNVKTAISLAPGTGLWETRGAEVGFNGNNRSCARVVAANTSFYGTTAKLNTSATLKMTRETSKAVLADAKKAGCSSKMVKAKHVYRSAAVDTERSIRITSGRVEAQIKFPTAAGMHAGIWLQSTTGPEIDMVESYGNRVTNVYHTFTGTKANTTEHKSSFKKSKSWYKKWHTYAVEFNSSSITFYIDGKVTKRATGLSLPPGAEYFPVMSIGTANWEVKKINPKKLPAKMYVRNLKITASS